MAEITIEFTGQTRDLNEFSVALFETEVLGAGTRKEIVGGGTITMQQMMMRRGYGIPQFIEIVLSTRDSVAAGIATNYIYETLTKHKSEDLTVRINRRGVSINRQKVATMINAEIANKSLSK
jgi:hypothetical protein